MSATAIMFARQCRKWVHGIDDEKYEKIECDAEALSNDMKARLIYYADETMENADDEISADYFLNDDGLSDAEKYFITDYLVSLGCRYYFS